VPGFEALSYHVPEKGQESQYVASIMNKAATEEL